MTDLYDPQSIEIVTEKIPMYVGFEMEFAGISVSDLEGCIPYDSRFRATRDDSIKVVESHICPSCKSPHMVVQDRFGAELVSPKTRVSGLQAALSTFEQIADEAKGYGAHINVTTACHVHIDARLFKPEDLKNTLEIYTSVENAAYRYFTGDLDEPRVLYIDLYNFAKSMRRFVQINLKHQGTNAFFNMHDKYWGWHVSTSDHSGNSRYTIEFRLFNATASREKLSEMISFAIGCSYLGLIGVQAGPPRYFIPDVASSMEEFTAVANITQIGMRLIEAKRDVAVINDA